MSETWDGIHYWHMLKRNGIHLLGGEVIRILKQKKRTDILMGIRGPGGEIGQ